MSDEVKVIKGNGVQSTITISNTDLVTTMVVRLMKKLKEDLAIAIERKNILEKELIEKPYEKAVIIAKTVSETDQNVISWKNLLKALNPKTDFEIVLNEDEIFNYVRKIIDYAKDGEQEIKFEIFSLNFKFDVKNDRRNTPYFYNVKIGDLRSTEFPVDISFQMTIDKTELTSVKNKIAEIQSKISNKQAIQDEATAKITEASLANNPDLQFLANIEIEPTNLLGY